MPKNILTLFLYTLLSTGAYSQISLRYADSVRKAAGIPELSYAVIRDSPVLELAALGRHAVNLKDTATLNDRFHIGSGTKAMTAFIIARYVEKGKLSWDTKFFSLFPSWEKNADAAYAGITLQDLLSHRAGIQPFQGNNDPEIPQLRGNAQEKRAGFGKFVLTLKPVPPDTLHHFTYSNADYTLAALMLEKVSGKSWEQLVQEVFNKELGMDVKRSWPENQRHKDTWGHSYQNGKLVPVASDTSYHLDLTEPAGDINISIRDYIKFIQLNIQGLEGRDNYLKAATYRFLHRGFENYALGWYNSYENGPDYSTHAGTAGTYYVLVAIDRKKMTGYIIFANAFNEATVNGVRQLMRKLKENYGSQQG